MAAQSSVTVKQARAFAGMQDASAEKRIESVVNEGSTELAFGLMVGEGTDFNQCLELALQADIPKGIVVHSHAYAKDEQLGDTGLKQYVILGVMTKGRIWVKVEEAVTQASDVRYRGVATGNEEFGAFAASADSTDLVDISAFANWKGYDSGTSLGLLEFDMTDKSGKVLDT